MRTIRLVPVLAVTLAAALAAQDIKPGPAADRAARGRGIVHYSKWITAGLAVTFTALGAHEHSNSTGAFSRLLDLCRANNADCALAPDGSYRTPAAEQLYQESIGFDRRARLRLVIGQASLLAAAGLFLADLGHHAGGPDNIPFHGLRVSVDPRAGGAQVSLRVTF